MKIEVIEPGGIKHAPYGHLQLGEIRVVDDQFGKFACANGWAKDVDGQVETGERGKLDHHNPEEWTPGAKLGSKKIQPASGKHYG